MEHIRKMPNHRILQQNKELSVSTNTRVLIVLGWLISFFIAYVLSSNIFYTILTFFYQIVGFVHAAKNIRYRFTLFMFNFGYLVFLTGGYVYNLISTGTFDYFSASSIAINHTCFSLFMSISIINTSYLLLERKKTEQLIVKKPASNWEQSVLAAILVVSWVFKLIYEYSATTYLMTFGYQNVLSVAEMFSGFVSNIAAFYYLSLFLFWASMPSKWPTLLSFASLVVVEIIILLSGERGEPISLLSTIFFYIFLRNRLNKKDIKVPKTLIVIILLLTPLVISGLQMLSYTRVNRTYNNKFSENIEEFVLVQGGSVKIVANAYDLKPVITEYGGNHFVIGTVINYLENNVVTRMLSNKTITSRSIEDVSSGNSFIATYGYANSPKTFLKGVGTGSTYIAEVYQDGGYILLGIVSILIAFLLSRIEICKCNSWKMMAIYISVFRYMALLPRGLTLQWFVSTFAVQNLLLLFCLYVLELMYARREKNKAVQKVST